MSNILIDHPSRLGDHLITNGLVREFCKHFDQVGIFTIPRYSETASFMFCDLKNLTIITLPTHRDKQLWLVRNKLRLTKPHFSKVLTIETDQESGVLFEKQYYQQAQVAFEKKWTNFFIQRDTTREEELFKKIAPNTPYVFVHDDSRYPIPASRLPHMPVVRPEKGVTDNVFDYCLLLERASEIHAIDSSFMFMADLLTYHNPEQKLFVHRYARQPNVLWNMPSLKKDWNVVL